MKTLSKKDLKIIEKLKSNKEFQKLNSYYSSGEEQFLRDAYTYVDAIKNNRMFCIIKSVSSSGMSRVISFHSFEKSYYRQYYSFFKSLGYTAVREGFRIYGCGMDMVFHTNYTIIRELYRLGFINKKQRDILSQKTPCKL